MMQTYVYAFKKRLSYAIRGRWPKITIKGKDMVRIAEKRKFRQYKPEYFTGMPDTTQYHSLKG